ncbi:uncharacterized protein [Venturia canescens]|uniref:uncharacterized protein n=1 Tax=Venturia canescens TaxID=32260 RepID=UPI001C9C50DB|nr:uncharacterized protein LOC122415690 [Venturia canescens]
MGDEKPRNFSKTGMKYNRIQLEFKTRKAYKRKMKDYEKKFIECYGRCPNANEMPRFTYKPSQVDENNEERTTSYQRRKSNERETSFEMSHGSQRMNVDNWNVEETEECSESRDDGPNDDVHNISEGNEMETSQSLCMDVEGRNLNDHEITRDRRTMS